MESFILDFEFDSIVQIVLAKLNGEVILVQHGWQEEKIKIGLFTDLPIYELYNDLHVFP